MRQISKLAIVLFTFSLVACNSSGGNIQTETKAQTLPENAIKVGGDRDKHNCIPSAGYSWSQSRKECVRIWAVGIRLYDVQNPNQGAYDLAIFSQDNNIAEVYLARGGANIPIILTKSGDNWGEASGIIKVEKAKDSTISLFENGKIISQSKLQ